jgi:hypothetical protein
MVVEVPRHGAPGGGLARARRPSGLLGLTDLDTRHKRESESENIWCQAHHVRNPTATLAKLTRCP